MSITSTRACSQDRPAKDVQDFQRYPQKVAKRAARCITAATVAMRRLFK